MHDKEMNKGRSTGIFGKSQKSENAYFGKYILITLITSCVVILFSSAITKVRQERFRMLETKKRLEEQVALLREKNTKLENDHTYLKDNPLRIEKEAREELGYLAPGEVVYEKYHFAINSPAKAKPETVITENRWKRFLFDGPFPWQFPTLIILVASAYYLISYHYEYKKLHKSKC